MADGIQNHEGVPENLRKLLAVTVRSIQWSYAIFWSLSTRQQGVLEWGDGYYNGDIKTRKTVPAMELKADKIGLQRSEQLRELYESLLDEETEQQAKRPCAALSPEDLTDTEWYYLVCMSFIFNPGQSLPGRALADGKTIWLCDAQYADSKVFSRSLLAKSASIQTVVCFPHLGGVIELGVTELVSEDPSLLQHIKTSLLELSKPVCSEKSSSAPHNTDDDSDPMCTNANNEIPDTLATEKFYSPMPEIKFVKEGFNELCGSIHDELNIDSPDDCSNGCEHNHQTEDSFVLEGTNVGISQVQSGQFIDDDFCYGVQHSMNSSDCISEDLADHEKTGKHMKLSSLDLESNDALHYRRTVSVILGKHRVIENLYLHSCNYKSSFMSWKKGGIVDRHRPRVQQRMLKKILFTVPWMHNSFSLSFQKEKGRKDCLKKLESDDIFLGLFDSDETREHQKFLALRSIVPSMSEIDKASLLSDTIIYLKELEARVEELESCMDSAEFQARTARKYTNMMEQTSDNCDKQIDNGKKPTINKRKASDIDERDLEPSKSVSKDGLPLDVKVGIKEQEVLIEMMCPYRENILLDIMDAMNNMYLDAHSVQSSTLDGILTLYLKSKFRGAAIAPVGSIKQTLTKIAYKC